jgi:deoxycytidylate deaminase
MSIRRAQIEARKSCFKQHKVGAVIMKGSRLLSTGYNTRQYSHILGTATRHAESAAVLKLLKEGRQHDLVGANCYVTRFTAGGTCSMARPCPVCYRLLQATGIRKIYYTNEFGETTSERLN